MKKESKKNRRVEDEKERKVEEKAEEELATRVSRVFPLNLENEAWENLTKQALQQVCEEFESKDTQTQAGIHYKNTCNIA
jgi:hypothetical protein